MNAAAASPGWVYILTNPSMPGLVKVGLTTRALDARAAELTAATGVPTPFVVAWGRAVSDCAYVEAAVHRMLDDRRVSGKREFFRCDVATARLVIEAAAGSELGRHYQKAGDRDGRRQQRAKEGAAMANLMATRQQIEAAGGARVGRRYRPAWPVRRARGRFRRRRGSNATGAAMIALAVLIFAVLAWSKPHLPGWLPRPVLASLVSVERL